MFRLPALLLSIVLPAVVLSSAGAQAPSPEETASTYARVSTDAPAYEDFALSRSETRRLRARRVRITGLTLVGASVAMVGTMALVGVADHSCDGTTSFACVDGPKVYALMGAMFAAPVLATGVALTTGGYIIERRERPRVQVSATATSLRLAF